MGIQLNGTSGTDIISAVDGSLTVEGLTISGDFNIADKIIHSGDTNTSIRFPAADIFTVETAGDERLRIEASGRIGINTTSSRVNGVHIYDKHLAINQGYPITWLQPNSSTSRGRMTCDSGGNYLFQFGSGNDEKIRFKSNGSVGIGTNNPDSTLHVHNGSFRVTNTAKTNVVEISTDGNIEVRRTGGSAYIDFSDNTTNDADCRIQHVSDGFEFSTGGQGSRTTKLAINSSGEVSIGAGAGSGKTLTLYGASSSSFRISKSGVLAYDHTFDGSTYTIANNNGSAGIPIIIGTKTGGVESLRIAANGKVGIGTQIPGGTLEIADTGEYQLILKDINNPGPGAEMAIGFKDSVNTIQGIVGFNKWEDDEFHIVNTNDGGAITLETNNGGTQRERMRISAEGDIYGPGGGRKNWFDNGSFDCREGRRANTSMDYGNHHAYGWVTDRFMSRNSVQWSRSTNVPANKGFSYSTLTNGAGGQIMQAVELPDYGDMGVFTPGSYWCVSFWSTAACNPSGSAFSYDLGSTKTDIPVVASGGYATTGETASGTSTGTFSRYYKVFGPMPSSIISGATAAYWIWGFSAAGYVTGFQLERVPTSTSKPTPYEHVHPAVTTARCRRYCWQFKNARLVSGYKRHDGQCNWQMQHPVPGTHMPSGSNQSADPYSIILHDAGIFTNFQGTLQNPGVTSVSRYEYDFRSGYFVMSAQSAWSSTHSFIPSWESAEFEVQHGFF